MNKMLPSSKIETFPSKHVDALGADHQSIQLEPIRLKPVVACATSRKKKAAGAARSKDFVVEK